MRERVLLSPPHLSGLEQQYIQEALDSNWIAPLGPQVDAFESELASYVGIKSALATASGTAAIHLALRYLGVRQGDIVLCSSFTFVASVYPVLYLGAEPIFIDSEPNTWNMSPSALERALLTLKKEGHLPKAVIVVNLYGQSADYDPIVELCRAYGVPIVEDAAESLGATYKGKQTGIFGHFGVFSFNGNKIITTAGGGMLVSDDEGAIAKCRFWSTQARDPAPYYLHSEYGYNYRLSNILAAIGRGQLQTLDQRVARRREIFAIYRQELGDLPGIDFMPEASFGRSNRWLTAMTMDPSIIKTSPIELGKYLNELNIETRPAWKPMHTQPMFKNARYFAHSEQISVCDKLYETGICLPSGTAMSGSTLQYVATQIRLLITMRH